ncbi:8187_t:CDS:2, partial [Racocetra persica]
VNLINQAKQARTEEEKSAVRQKISELENREIPNTNSPSSDNKEPNNHLPLTIFLVVVISGIAIIAG